MCQSFSKLIVISAPSGTGKTSVFSGAKSILPALSLSVSCTTRSPREGEKDGVDYFFISRETFRERIEKHDFLEWAEVYDNYYGTSLSCIDELQKSGQIVVLDIDVQGTLQLMEKESLEAFYIFITPPSLDILKERLTNRGTETAESLQKRLSAAEKELSFQNRYDMIIENNDLDLAIDQFLTAIIRHNLKQHNYPSMDVDTLYTLLLKDHPKSSDPERLKNIISNILKTD